LKDHSLKSPGADSVLDICLYTLHKNLTLHPITITSMFLTSPAFSHEGRIPSKYTCDGENISPPLSIGDVPESAKSLVLLMDDPDVPTHIREDGIWDHWVVFNIPPGTTNIPEGVNPPGTIGNNTRDVAAYGGPCPPDREHRYFFKLFALNAMLDIPEGTSKKDVLAGMEGHITAHATLMGRYERAQNAS
jgi:Raf kinase inhibitor-like YbhB/YbcL family protein